jgi:hypothetical protein
LAIGLVIECLSSTHKNIEHTPAPEPTGPQAELIQSLTLFRPSPTMEYQKQGFSHTEQLDRADTSVKADVNIKEVETLLIAHDRLFSEGRPKWEVVKENKKAMALIFILLVSPRMTGIPSYPRALIMAAGWYDCWGH